MRKSLLKNLIALSFALGALVFVAGNVYADDGEVGEIGDGIGGITCHQNYEPVRNNICWEDRVRFMGLFGIPCKFTGRMNDVCLYM